MSDWREAPLGTLVNNFDYMRKPVRSVERKAGDYPYYGASGIVDLVDAYIFEGEYLLVSEDGENLRTRSTPIAFTARGRFWVNNHAHVLRGNQNANTSFLRYALNLTDISGYLTGTTQPKLSRRSLDRIVVRLPALVEQNAIAEVLDALEDKITSNSCLHGLIDSFLAALFDSVAQKSGETWALRDVAVVNRAIKERSREGALRYLDISAVDVGTFRTPPLTLWTDAPSRARRAVSAGDTIWSMVRPNRRSHALLTQDDPLLVASTGLAILSPTGVGFAYLHEATKRPDFARYLETVAEGSAYPAVRSERFLDAPIPSANPEDRDRFEAIAAPLRQRAANASRESEALATLRDTLLPPLMSGKLRVRDAERAMSEVL